MEAPRSSETLVTYNTTRRSKPKDINFHRHENLNLALGGGGGGEYLGLRSGSP
jgi:hypothetical protein